MSLEPLETSESPLIVARDGRVATLTLNRPRAMNSLNDALVAGLLAALREIGSDPEVRVIVLTGQGRAFCAGGDLFYLESLGDPIAARAFIQEAGSITAAIMALPKPVIAMVNGVAAGAGFSLALACDLIFCAHSARFVQSFSKIGLVPDCGSTSLLPRFVGHHKAMELMLTARPIDGETASRLGLVNVLAEDEHLETETRQFAADLTQGPPLAFARTKRLLHEGVLNTFARALACEVEAQTECLFTDDFREGVLAFREKRPPHFLGK